MIKMNQNKKNVRSRCNVFKLTYLGDCSKSFRFKMNDLVKNKFYELCGAEECFHNTGNWFFGFK